MMDVELFLEGLTKWEEDSPHQLVMLYEMFEHATNEGQKEAEGMVCQGHWQGLPKLGPEADLSAIQLVGPKTTKEEIVSLYLEVYKQQRLPGSPTWGTRANTGGDVLLQRLPRAEGREDTQCHHEALIL